MNLTKPSLSSCYVTGQLLEGEMVSPVLGRGGGSQTFSTTANVISIKGSYLCLKKAKKRDSYWLVHSSWQVMQWHQTGGKKWCYITDKATFTQATGQPSGKQGTPTLTEETKGEKKKGIVGMKRGILKEVCGKQRTAPSVPSGWEGEGILPRD